MFADSAHWFCSSVLCVIWYLAFALRSLSFAAAHILSVCVRKCAFAFMFCSLRFHLDNPYMPSAQILSN